MNFCKYCGAKIVEESVFCEVCGKQLIREQHSSELADNETSKAIKNYGNCYVNKKGATTKVCGVVIIIITLISCILFANKCFFSNSKAEKRPSEKQDVVQGIVENKNTVKQNNINNVPVSSGVPTIDKSPTDSTPNLKLHDGIVDGIQGIKLGDSIQTVISKLGQPQKKGSYQGTQYIEYDYVRFYYPLKGNEVIIGLISMSTSVSINGISAGMNLKEAAKICGIELSPKKSMVGEGYYVLIKQGNYELYCNLQTPEGPIFSIELLKKK